MTLLTRSPQHNACFQKTRWLASCFRLHKPVTDWLETLPHSIYGLNM